MRRTQPVCLCGNGEADGHSESGARGRRSARTEGDLILEVAPVCPGEAARPRLIVGVHHLVRGGVAQPAAVHPTAAIRSCRSGTRGQRGQGAECAARGVRQGAMLTGVAAADRSSEAIIVLEHVQGRRRDANTLYAHMCVVSPLSYGFQYVKPRTKNTVG